VHPWWSCEAATHGPAGPHAKYATAPSTSKLPHQLTVSQSITFPMARRGLSPSLIRSLCATFDSPCVPVRRHDHLRMSAFHRAFGTSAPLPPAAKYTGRLAENEHTVSPFRSVDEVYRHMLPEEEHPRSLIVRSIPKCAIAEDIQLLFEESGFVMSVSATLRCTIHSIYEEQHNLANAHKLR
jgi:hypothetical protein